MANWGCEMKLYIVRHADKLDGDFFNDRIGHNDSPISPEGKKRTQRLSAYFESRAVCAVYASEYVRAAQTAEYVASAKNLSVQRDARLNEIDSGVTETLTAEELRVKFPEFWADFLRHDRDVRFPGAENGEEVKARQKGLLADLILKGEDAVLISHEGYIRLLLCHVLGLPTYRRHLFHVGFCGVTELRYDEEAKLWSVYKVNEAVQD